MKQIHEKNAVMVQQEKQTAEVDIHIIHTHAHYIYPYIHTHTHTHGICTSWLSSLYKAETYKVHRADCQEGKMNVK